MATRPNFVPYGIGAAPNFGGPAFPMQDALLNPATPVPPGGGVINVPAPVGPVVPHTGINPPGQMNMMGNRTLYTSNSRGISAISTNVHVTSHYVTDCDHSDPESIEAARNLLVGMVVFALNPGGDYPRKRNRMNIVDQTRSLRVQFRDLASLNAHLASDAGRAAYKTVQSVLDTWSFSGFVYRDAAPHSMQRSLAKRGPSRMLNLIVSHRGSCQNVWCRFQPIRGSRLYFIVIKAPPDDSSSHSREAKRQRLAAGPTRSTQDLEGPTSSENVWKVLPWTDSFADTPSLKTLMYSEDDTVFGTNNKVPSFGRPIYAGQMVNFEGQSDRHAGSGGNAEWRDLTGLKHAGRTLSQAEIMFRI